MGVPLGGRVQVMGCAGLKVERALMAGYCSAMGKVSPPVGHNSIQTTLKPTTTPIFLFCLY